MQDCGGIPLLLQAAGSPSAGQQRAAAAALANLCSEPSLLQRVVAEPGSLPALVGLAQSRDRDVQAGTAKLPAASAPLAPGKAPCSWGLDIAATCAGAACWNQAAVKPFDLADVMGQGCSHVHCGKGLVCLALLCLPSTLHQLPLLHAAHQSIRCWLVTLGALPHPCSPQI